MSTFAARRALLAAPFLVSLFAGAAQAQAPRPEYRLSVVANRPIPIASAAFRWAELVNQRSNGRINIKVYPGSSLVGGDNTREFSAVRQGVVDFNVSSTINWSTHVKELNLFNLPFLIPDYKSFDALTSGGVARELDKLIEARGVVNLAWAAQGAREVSNSRHEIRTPADMKGLKFRVVGSPIFNETFSALGANPTQMSFADAQPALASGAVDGQENPLSLFKAAKFHTLSQKHLTLWGYVNDPVLFGVSKTVYESFSAQDRSLIREAAQQAARELTTEARRGVNPGRDDALLKSIEADGVKITTLNEAQRRAFVEAVRPVYRKWSAQIGSALVTRAEKEIAATAR